MRFKEGDIITCINNKVKILRGNMTYPITIGKNYTVLVNHNIFCHILNDKENKGVFIGNMFKTKDEIREDKINQILE